MTSPVVVAAVQAGSILFDTPATLAKAEQYVREADAAGARLIVLPEAFLGGYPKGEDFGIVVGSRSPEGRELYRRYRQAAVELDGPEVTRLAELASELAVHLVVGVIERDGGTLYCTAVFISPDAGLVAHHRKLMPTAAERYLWGQGDGSTMPAVRTDLGVLGAAICWENYMPLFRQSMYAKGVQLWCAPTVDDRDQWQATMRHIALEGRCFVISANQYLTGDDGAVLINGGSTIISPLGEILAGPLRAGEGILVAELDLAELDRGYFDFDSVGHYARPDIFTLSVDESPHQTVVRRN
ncbi:carbon-nitrogen hydrolase family protein [Kribbella sp. NPDC054772]